jgi:hypothetical protein
MQCGNGFDAHYRNLPTMANVTERLVLRFPLFTCSADTPAALSNFTNLKELELILGLRGPGTICRLPSLLRGLSIRETWPFDGLGCPGLDQVRNLREFAYYFGIEGVPHDPSDIDLRRHLPIQSSETLVTLTLDLVSVPSLVDRDLLNTFLGIKTLFITIHAPLFFKFLSRLSFQLEKLSLNLMTKDHDVDDGNQVGQVLRTSPAL